MNLIANNWKRWTLNAAAVCSFMLFTGLAQAAPLAAGNPILLPGTHGGFDFIRLDSANDRLLLGHEGNKSLDVFDLKSRKLLKSVPTGTAQDAAADAEHGYYYVSGNDPSRTVIVNSKSLTVTGGVPLPAATDLIAYDPVTGQIHECNDTAAEEWVINPTTKKVIATIHLKGRGLEDLAFGPGHKRLFQAVKGSNAIAVIDPANNKVLNEFPLTPDKGPHGIAVVPENEGLLVACSGKLVLLDRSTGKVLARAQIASRVDEMAYDPGIHLAYCASRQGEISVVRVEHNQLILSGSVPDERGTGSITVDPKTHTVWIAYHKGDECFVQPYTPTK